MRISHHLSRAFTLVELLVVISIIALLITLLLPVLARARGAAKTAKSTNQIHQLTLALFVYTQDHKGYLPFRRYTPPPPPPPEPGPPRSFWCQRLTTLGYVTDPFIFWGPFRDTSWLSTTHLNGDSNNETLLHYLLNEPKSSGCEGAHFYAGYGINVNLAPQRYSDTSMAMNRTYRFGTNVPVNPTYTEPNPPLSNVLLLGEQVFNAPNVAPLDSSVGKYINQGMVGVGTTKAPVFTPEGKATRSYLDGHAASRNAEDLNWVSTSPVTGHWVSIWTANNVRIAPWFYAN